MLPFCAPCLRVQMAWCGSAARLRARRRRCPTEVRSVLSELWHAEPRCGSDVLKVQLSPEKRRGAEVQGDHADDESARGCPRTRRRARRWSSAAAGRPVRSQQTQRNDGRRRADGRSKPRRARSGRRSTRGTESWFRGDDAAPSAGRQLGRRRSVFAACPAAWRQSARRHGRCRRGCVYRGLQQRTGSPRRGRFWAVLWRSRRLGGNSHDADRGDRPAANTLRGVRGLRAVRHRATGRADVRGPAPIWRPVAGRTVSLRCTA
jgi:hypothetical protein